MTSGVPTFEGDDGFGLPWARRVGCAADTGKNVPDATVVVSTPADDFEPSGLKPIDATTSTPTSAANASHLRMGVVTAHPRLCQAT